MSISGRFASAPSDYIPSHLENALGFAYQPFRRYVLTDAAKTIPLDQLNVWAAEMVSHDHPAVRCAGGWMLAAVATRNCKGYPGWKPRITLEQRLTSLAVAQAVWSEAATELSRSSLRSETPEQSSQLLGLSLRARMARAHQPSFALAARWLDGEPANTNTLLATTAITRQRLLDLGASLAWSVPQSIKVNHILSGVANEVTAALLLGTSHLILPGSMRRDHNDQADLRADLVAVAATPDHKKTLIQVSSTQQDPAFLSPSVFHVNTKQDLTLRPGLYPIETLRALVMQARGEQLAAGTVERLATMSSELTQRLAAFTPGTAPRPNAVVEKMRAMALGG